MTITRELKEEVIRLSNEGKGRNEVARLLAGQISSGSVGSIIRAARRQTTFPNTHDGYGAYKRKQTSPDVNIWGQNESSQPQGLSFDKKEPTLSQQQDTPDHNVIPTTSPRPSTTGKAIISDKTNSGPLSWLGIDFITNKETSTGSKYSDINKEFDDIIDNEQQNETTQTEKEDRPSLSLYSIEDQGPSVRTKPLPNPPIEDSPINLVDLDSVIHFIKTDQQERQAELLEIERQRQVLGEEQQRLSQMMQTIDERNNDLRRREDEIKPLLPSVRELQSNGITFDILIAFMMAINEKSASENIDLKTAAWDMVRDFREYRTLGTLKRIIAQAEERLSLLGNTIRQYEAAITTLTHLKLAGYTKKQIMDLVAVVSNWNAGFSHINGKILDSELIDVDHQQPTNINGNIQQKNDNPKQPNNNNPQQPLRESELVRLQLLKENAANMLNRIGRTG